MSNYTKSTNFATKDNLSPGDPLKIVRGTEIDTEFNNIATAVATKTDNSAAAITGGTITGITDLAVADGGTGASTAAGGLNNLLPTQTGNANKYLQTDGTNATWDAVTLSTADITGTLPVANGGTGVTASTGTGSVVLSNSPTLVTPALGTPASGVATNLTGLPISTGVSGLGTGVATFLGTPSSANLISAVTDETGTGSLVFANSPTLVTPTLGTPASATLTNATGLPVSTGISGLGTGVATFLATPSSANLISALTDETGTGSAVFATSPTLVTPILGTPTSATLTNATGLPISTGVSGLGTGIATALAVNTGSAGAPVLFNGALGTPTSGTVTNLTGTASININGTVGATTATTGAFTTLSATGVTTVQAGTALLPALTTTGDTNTGIWFPAADTIAFTEGGVESMRIDSSGNVGIGTSTVGAKLDLQGSAIFSRIKSNVTTYNGFRAQNDNGNFYFGLDDASGGFYGSANARVLYADGAYPMVFYTNAVERMRLDSSGNLGIGTTTPAAKIDARGANALLAGTTYGSFYFRDISTTGQELHIRPNAGKNGFITFTENTVSDNWVVGTEGGNTGLLFKSGSSASNTERMRLDSAGRLGLGVTPSSWNTYKAISLGDTGSSIAGTANQIILTSNAYYNTGYIYSTTNFAALYHQTTGQHRWYNAPSGTAGNAITFTQAMTLDASGNLLVGTTSGSDKLNIAGNATLTVTQPAYGLVDSSNSNYKWIIQNLSSALRFYDITANAERARFDSSGNLGIGTSSPATILNVVGGSLATTGAGILAAGGLTAGRLVSDGVKTTINPIHTYNDDRAYEISAGSTSAYVSGIVVASRSFTGTGGEGVSLWTRNTERMRIDSSGNVLVTGTGTGSLGYGTGSGGAVTQGTSRTTGVTLSKPTGGITMFSAAGSATAATFTVTNTLVAATDTIILNQKSGTNLYVLLVTAVAAGSFNITFYTTGGTATDAPVINFALIKGVTA